MKDQINNLCKIHGFEISNIDDNIFSCALGLGDLARLLSCLKYNLITKPLHINLGLFFVYYSNSINYIEFRLKMIQNIIDSNHIDKKQIIFYYNELKKTSNGQIRFVDYVDCSKIQKLKLHFNTNKIESNIQEEYIIFHTKSRFHLNKEEVFQDLKVFERFISTFKTKYKIYILGEKEINRNNAEILHSPDIITQIYDILINLANNNDINDQTVDVLVDNLNYDNFVKDVALIQNAKYNIHFGDGGSMNYSLIFGKHNTIVYNRDMDEWDKKILEKENSFFYNNINDFLNKIQNELSDGLGLIKPELRPIQKKEEISFVFNKLYNKHNKINKNAYFLCHGGLGDLFFMCGAIRYLSFFYNTIFLFCSNSALKNLQILYSDINVKFITYDKWYETQNVNNKWPKVSEDWYKTTAPYFYCIHNQYEIFDWKKYIQSYLDLSEINNKMDAWYHWSNHGKYEGRTFFIKESEELFDWQKYINNNNDLTSINNKQDAWYHWINYGKNEGRIFYLIDIDLEADFFVTSETFHKNLNCYVSKETISKYKVSSFYNKITNQIFCNYNNYKNYNITEDITSFIKESEESFDWEKYVKSYHDLSSISNKKDALHHWVNFGKNENRNFYKKNINFNSLSSLDNTSYKEPYYFLIQHFYNEINMYLSIYYDYFYIPSTSQSWELYKVIKDYKVVFLHFASSCGSAYIPDNEWKHIYNDEYLIINPNKNHYDPTISLTKYELANQYLNLLSLDYIDIILNASDIYVCDSSFAAMIFPLRIKDRLKADNMIIYDRYYPKKPYNIPTPVHLPKISKK